MLLPGPGETIQPFCQKSSTIDFGVNSRVKNAFLLIVFNLNHVLFRKIVSLSFKFMKNLLIYVAAIIREKNFTPLL